MEQSKKWDLLIIGGGLAGLTAALHLSKHNFSICLIEKQRYPHHKVCGEYVSNEVLEYLKYLSINPFGIGAKKISKFEITNTNGDKLEATLPFGGFGISRYAFDDLLYKTVKDKVDIIFDRVEKIAFQNEEFTISTKEKKILKASFVIGAFGKRSNIDTFLKRKFILKSSPWLAVKAHYNYDFPDDKVSLHNFNGGYCGISKIETNAVNACYLTTFKSFKKFGDITKFQDNTLSENPFLKDFFRNAEPVFEKPLSISQVSFGSKNPVEEHIFMLGDSAGLIHPLCGNGMAIAIHSAKLFSELFIENFDPKNFNRTKMEQAYSQLWHRAFTTRLKTGRLVQQALLNPTLAKIGFTVAKNFPSVVPALIKKTHGTKMI